MDMRYFKEIRRLLDLVETQEAKAMERVVETLTDVVIARRAIYVFGASHAGILTQELFYRAGGLIVINPIFSPETMVTASPICHTSRMERLVGYGELIARNHPIAQGDAVIVHSVSGRNPVAIEVAIEAKRRGATVICLTNLRYAKSVTSRHPGGKLLHEISDIVLDNHGEPGDACIAVEGARQKTAPTSTVIGAAILNGIVAEVASRVVARGAVPPPILYSANQDGGDARNREIYEAYKDCIHYKF